MICLDDLTERFLPMGRQGIDYHVTINRLAGWEGSGKCSAWRSQYASLKPSPT